MTRKSFFGGLAAALVGLAGKLAAQTQVASSQLAPGPTGRVWVNLDNQVTYARIEGGSLLNEAGDVVLRLTGIAPTWRTEQRIVEADNPALALALAATPVTGSLIVARNGLVQWANDDYTVSDNIVSLPKATVGDRIILRYQVP